MKGGLILDPIFVDATHVWLCESYEWKLENMKKNRTITPTYLKIVVIGKWEAKDFVVHGGYLGRRN
jgi:hypothetical protein